ncbi:undecaprenyldiphospho-muramoylpentapeptide beta-N-acetylglucosaminyltransferase [Agarivorans sp. 1_MG-2023]|uniref:undecaprenyldiphospho-muramoylpentapeptide beta-N-acetylglucosaminyltransferase n=1 Tax=Agarivorans sp. 1_MG-2023 TaxID=3062634 RepID=UPI0026E1AF04|nr:undecaprenyldiphospho-muramoylpentapeptide beta-N-acetylglucosaminyltransferase [Agarivorans sp. 1_MG-2023]MDO6764554.1 undecaprenyldiphospho-muramoylpentapeptide beta-N-acetylglucosaminyltransferase [Agarivorans sp. 1_MG-2023]
MVDTTQKKLLVMAGGTGGHVFPGLAVADYLKEQGWEISWLGTAERMEAQLVPKHGYPIDFISIKGVRGNGLLRKLAAPFKLLNAVRQARAVIKRFQPDVVLGMGGFASGPGGIAAWLMGKPLVLHEQNAAAGLTNKMLAKIAKKSLMAFPGALPNADVVGNPVRHSVITLPEKELADRTDYNLLVIGGSLGAQVFNEKLAAGIKHSGLDLNIWHQAGKDKQASAVDAYQCQGLDENLSDAPKIVEFIDDMAAAYQWADVILCRAGALTVSEVAAAGIPALFVPLPYAVDDHQTKNAQFLVKANAARLLKQSDFLPQNIAALLHEFADPALRLACARNARQQASVNATEKVAAVCQALTKSS